MVSFVRTPRPLDPPQPVELSTEQRAVVHMCASLLLDYPDEDGGFDQRLGAVAAVLEGLPAPVAGPLEEFISVARRRGARAMAEHYVDVFDRQRRCCLYLSYYAVGDTRQRGAALLAFKQTLAAAGWELAAEELPDYLPVVLELSARSGEEVAQALLAGHREGIEVLRSALVDASSPYTHLVQVVSMTLPAIDAAMAERIRALVAAGPPTELVGVTDVLPFPTVPAAHGQTAPAPAGRRPAAIAAPIAQEALL